MKRVEAALRPLPLAEEQALPADQLALRVALQLAVAVRSVPVLGQLDPACRAQLAALPRGLALFSCGTIPSAWVWVDGRASRAGIGAPPESPLVEIRFQSPATAAGALGDRIDQLAAVHDGRIRIDGLVPLADGLDLVFSRIRHYLPVA